MSALQLMMFLFNLIFYTIWEEGGGNGLEMEEMCLSLPIPASSFICTLQATLPCFTMCGVSR